MTSIHPYGEASFSTFNIRRRGQTTPTVEGGASQRVRPKRGRGAAGRARIVESGAEQRSGRGVGARAVAEASQPARHRDRSRRGDGWGGRDGGRCSFGTGFTIATGRSGHRGAVYAFVRAGDPADRAGDSTLHPGDRAGSNGANHAANDDAGLPASVDDRPGAGAREQARRPGRRATRAELLVDRSGGGDSIAGAGRDHSRGDPLLAGGRRRERLAVAATRRSEPPVRRPGDSSSSYLDPDVRSASRHLAHI
jgi:hypothetical protein